MPVKGVSEDVRIAVMMRFALGVKDEARGGAPREVPWFVPMPPGDDPKDPLYEQVVAAYGENPRKLRAMLLFDEGVASPTTGQELSWAVYNRAYGAGRGLRCIGTGGSAEHGRDEGGEPFDRRGVAVTRDEQWARLIAERTQQPPVQLAPGRWRIQCEGRDCRKFYRLQEVQSPKPPMAEGHDADAACKLTGVLSFLLLDPTDDRPICTARLTTGSINSIRDIQSGLRTIAAFNLRHRSSAIPFTIVRTQSQIPYAGRRTRHYTIKLHADLSEVNRIGMVPVEQVFLGVHERETYFRLLSETPVSYDDVHDVLPQTHDPRLLNAPQPEAGAGATIDVAAAAPGAPLDRDELVLDQIAAAESPLMQQVEVDAGPPEPEAPPTAQPDDHDPAGKNIVEDLKARMGLPKQWSTDPAERQQQADVAEAARALVNRARIETGDEATGTPFGDMRMKHARWLMQHLDARDRHASADDGGAGGTGDDPASSPPEQGSLL